MRIHTYNNCESFEYLLISSLPLLSRKVGRSEPNTIAGSPTWCGRCTTPSTSLPSLRSRRRKTTAVASIRYSDTQSTQDPTAVYYIVEYSLGTCIHVDLPAESLLPETFGFSEMSAVARFGTFEISVQAKARFRVRTFFRCAQVKDFFELECSQTAGTQKV